MRLLIKQGSRTINELRFTGGPVYIGRHTNSQVSLPARSVSRQHAVIFCTEAGKWMVEDLDSANKTYLNDKKIHKAEIKTGDILLISDYTIEIDLEGDTKAKKRPIDLEDTLTKGIRTVQVMVRKADAEHAPEMRLPSKRAHDFVRATEAICEADSTDQLLLTLLGIGLHQFSPYRVWCALRNQPAGPMTVHGGKKLDGTGFELSELKLGEKITEAIEKSHFILFPRVSGGSDPEQIRSAMIGPIVGDAGCFGVLYVDNNMAHEPYSPSDLDYLMMIAIHTAAIIKNF